MTGDSFNDGTTARSPGLEDSAGALLRSPSGLHDIWSPEGDRNKAHGESASRGSTSSGFFHAPIAILYTASDLFVLFLDIELKPLYIKTYGVLDDGIGMA